jgi:hypothetical protein
VLIKNGLPTKNDFERDSHAFISSSCSCLLAKAASLPSTGISELKPMMAALSNFNTDVASHSLSCTECFCAQAKSKDSMQ